MAKNDLVLLDSIIDEYIQNKRPSENCGEVFEFFATEQILKNYAFSEQQILSGSVDGRNDGGIDEFFVLVNGHLAEGIPEEFWPKSNLANVFVKSFFIDFPIFFWKKGALN